MGNCSYNPTYRSYNPIYNWKGDHLVRIPIKQPVFHGKYPAVFFWGFLSSIGPSDLGGLIPEPKNVIISGGDWNPRRGSILVQQF